MCPVAALLKLVVAVCCVLAMRQLWTRHFLGLHGHSSAARGPWLRLVTGRAPLCLGESQFPDLASYDDGTFIKTRILGKKATSVLANPMLGPSS